MNSCVQLIKDIKICIKGIRYVSGPIFLCDNYFITENICSIITLGSLVSRVSETTSIPTVEVTVETTIPIELHRVLFYNL